MTKEDYKKKLSEIRSESNKKCDKVHIEYADFNNKYELGDILQDHHQIILVNEIKYTLHNGDCICNYRGQVLTKKLKPHKNKGFETMYGLNVERKLNKNI
tara:strand:- start:400 stop:699 length:300 start_codon:yes stop_codon:yes gene_type:complete